MNARSVVVFLATAVVTTLPAMAGPNDFFGGNIGGAPDSAQGGQAAAQAAGVGTSAPNMTAPGGDYTADEKRMQKKYRANVADAQRLIAKATEMMKSSDKKLAVKGRIMKEIGEHRLADLKANNPFPEIANSGKRVQ